MRRILTLTTLLLGLLAHGVLGASAAASAAAPLSARAAAEPTPVSAISTIAGAVIRADTSAFTFDSFDAE